MNGIRRDLARQRDDGREVATIGLHPATRRGIAADYSVFGGEDRLQIGRLFGIPVIEDPTLAPGTWRLEHG